MTYEIEEEKERLKKEEELEKRREDLERKKIDKEEWLEKQHRSQRQQIDSDRIRLLLQLESDSLDSRSQPIR
jgi:hypothetical protein